MKKMEIFDKDGNQLEMDSVISFIFNSAKEKFGEDSGISMYVIKDYKSSGISLVKEIYENKSMRGYCLGTISDLFSEDIVELINRLILKSFKKVAYGDENYDMNEIIAASILSNHCKNRSEFGYPIYDLKISPDLLDRLQYPKSKISKFQNHFGLFNLIKDDSLISDVKLIFEFN